MMELRAGRCLVVLAACLSPAVVMLFGCEVDDSRFPGLPNEVPNTPGAGNGAASSSGSGSTTTTTTLVPPDAAPAETVCDIASALALAGSESCKQCQEVAIADTGQCFTAFGDCSIPPTCDSATTCVAGCDGVGVPPTCVQSCTAASPSYKGVLDCLLKFCAELCGPPTKLPCDVDAG